MIIQYRHYITHLGVQTEVFPFSFKENCTIDWEDDDKQMFKRRVLKGKLKFRNVQIETISDYDYFKAIDDDDGQRCDELSYLLQRSCDGGVTYTDYWNGYFVVTDGEFDIDRCYFEVEPFPDDIYRCILENEEKEFTISVAQRKDVTTYLLPNYEYHVERSAVGLCADLPDPDPCTTWHILHTETIDGVTTTIYYREIAVVACEAGVPAEPDGSGWVLKDNTCSIDGLATYVREASWTPSSYNPNPDVQAGNCNDDGSYSPPPHRKRLTVTKQNTTPAPIIIGMSTVSGAPAIPPANHTTDFCYQQIYSVKDNPGSTYLWAISLFSGTGTPSIISGGTSATVTVDLTALASAVITLSCTETTSCGASSTASINITRISGGGFSSVQNANVELIGRTSVCVGSKGRYYLNATSGATLVISGGTSTGGSIAHIADEEYEVTFGTIGTTILSYSGGGTCTPVNPSLTVNVVELPTTPNIKGLTTVCKSQQNKYFVPVSDQVDTYDWTVSGGTITAGQGTNEITVTWDGSAGTGYVYCKETIGCGCQWLLIVDPDSDTCDIETHPPFYFCPPNSEVNYDKVRLLYDLFLYFKDNICDEITAIVSDFFEWNPIGDTPGYVAGDNYITGTTNHVNLLGIADKNDVLALSQGADFKLSWKKLTEILREVFQVYWYVDSLGNVRFEHVNYFQRAVKFDLTSGAFINKAFYRNIYSYDSSKRPKYERFKWSESINTDFVGAEIRYDSLCVNKDPKKNISNNGVNYLTTDIAYVNADPDRVSKDGIILLALELIGGAYSVNIEPGLITGIAQPNAHLSWANLHYNYFRYYRVLLEGNMNLVTETFLSVKRTKVQKEVKFNYCCDDDLDGQTDLITTEIGDGAIANASLNLKNNILKTDLLFEE